MRDSRHGLRRPVARVRTGGQPGKSADHDIAGVDEARQLYLKARDLAEKLRITDARALYGQAVEKDPKFALVYLGLATTAGTTGEFANATKRAVALAGNVSEGERHLILAGDSGLKQAIRRRPGALQRGGAALPGRRTRSLTLLGTVYFGRQEYQNAIKDDVQATKANPDFTTPYNQLGYAVTASRTVR